MTDDDYFDYQSLALASKYSVIPYTKVSQLRYMKNQSQISYKLGFTDKFIENNILLKHSYDTLPKLNQLHIHSNISSLKIANLRTMFGMMPEDDKQYYETEIAKLLEVRALTRSATDETENIPAFDTAEISMKSNSIVTRSQENIGSNVVTDVRARKRLNKNDSAASISNNKKAATAKTIGDAQTSKGRFVIDSTRPPLKSIVITKSCRKSTDEDNGKKKTKNVRPTADISSQLNPNEKIPSKTRASRTSKTTNQTRKKSK
ncbi:uncharacterized protein LOC119083022 [Bradysia coprophila]|uniref:uncharacterized protein LOC119083022 n=1 Tax=Bradysia coprophila TaxID=38358 RepID=UPI00187D9D27|nr:uncharacterized protein LOC119083022 [Bradysia coprophila]